MVFTVSECSGWGLLSILQMEEMADFLENVIEICTYPSHVSSSPPIAWADEYL
jgi:hypothetical protein